MTETLTMPSNKEVTGKIEVLGVPYQTSTASELYDGIMGFAPMDESAGPLAVHQWFDKGVLSKNEFSIALNPNPPAEGGLSIGSWLTLGGLHDEESQSDTSWVSLRIAGSFHW